MNIINNLILFVTDLYTTFYGDVFAGYIHLNTFYKPTYFENYFYLLPSFFNHWYANYFYKEYLYSKNNLIYHSHYKPSCLLTPPLMEFKINNQNFKTQITKFANNIPLKYIFMYYQLRLINENISYKYLKNGFKNISKELIEVEDKSLVQLLQ